MNLQVSEYIVKSKTNQPCINIIKNNKDFFYDLIFDADIEVGPVYFLELKFIIRNKSYSVKISKLDQINFLIELLGSNKNIQKLTINASILNTLLQTNLYKDIFPYVQDLFIEKSLQSVINNLELQEFQLNYLTLEEYDPQFLKEFSTINMLIEYSKHFNILNMNFKRFLQIDLKQLKKFHSEISFYVTSYTSNIAPQCFQILNEMNNIKKVKIEYPYVDKTYPIQQQLANLNKEIYLIVVLEQSSNLQQLTSLLKNKAPIKHVSLKIPYIINTSLKGSVLCPSSQLTSLSINIAYIDIFETMLKQAIQIKNNLIEFSLQIDFYTSLKYLIQFLQGNNTLKALHLNFTYQHDKYGKIHTELLPVIKNIPSLKVLSLQLKSDLKSQGEHIQNIYSYLPNINISQLNLIKVKLSDFIEESVITSFKNFKSLSNLSISFIDNNIYQKVVEAQKIHKEIQLNSSSLIKLYLQNFMSPIFDTHIYQLMNLSIDQGIRHYKAYMNIFAPLMLFSPNQIYLDLYLD